MRLLTMLFISTFFLNCNWNGGEIVIPCSNEIDLGTFEVEKDLPTDEVEVVFENQFGQRKSLFYNTVWGLAIRNREDSRNFNAQSTPCVESGAEDEYLWQEEQNTATILFNLDDGISVKEAVAIDFEKPQEGVVGKYFIVRTQGKNTGNFGGMPVMGFSKNRIQTSQNSNYDFGYEFFPKLTLNDREYENVYQILDPQSVEITKAYLSEKGELIAFEERDWLFYTLIE